MCDICGVCIGCGKLAAVNDSILSFLDQAHPFYEGAYDAQVHFASADLQTVKGRIVLPFITFGYLKAIIDNVPKGSHVLELGCGGGIQLLASRYEVTAVDLSLGSLRKTPFGYRRKIQADISVLDFGAGTFDAIVASCFWEHFTPAQKESLLVKFRRWLKPSGVLVLLFDTASQNPCFRWLRRFPDLYRQCFIEHDGHVGLERVTENQARFDRHDLQLVHGIGLNRTAQHMPVYVWMAPYAAVSSGAHVCAKLGASLYEHPRLAQVLTAAIHTWDLSLGRAFPLDWSRLFLGVWRKRTPPVID